MELVGQHEGRVAVGAPRGLADRRVRPTPLLSRHWLRGRRRGARRADEGRGQYVDRYRPAELALCAWLLVASLADLGLTALHLEAGGAEANPLMAWFLDAGGLPAFTAAKLAATVPTSLFLLLHVRFRGAYAAMVVLGFLYVGVMATHLAAALDRGAL